MDQRRAIRAGKRAEIVVESMVLFEDDDDALNRTTDRHSQPLVE